MDKVDVHKRILDGLVQDLSDFGGLLHKTLLLHKLSPLHNFGQVITARLLRRHSESFVQYVHERCGEGTCAAHMFPISTAANGAMPSSGRHSLALTASIDKSSVKPGAAFGPVTVILYPAGLTEKEESKAGPGFMWYPICMVRASNKACQLVSEWLRLTFDASLAPLKIQPFNLAYMAGKWGDAGNVSSSKPTPLSLTLQLCAECPGLDSITLTIPREDWAALSSAVKAANYRLRDTGSTIVRNTTEVLLKHLASTTGIKEEACTISRIATPVASLGIDGKIKFHTSERCDDFLIDLAILATRKSNSQGVYS